MNSMNQENMNLQLSNVLEVVGTLLIDAFNKNNRIGLLEAH
jgi:hypothetical protein